MTLVNGIQQETISVFDRGLSYGDGLFETIAIVNGQPLLWPLHMQRLRSGCEKLNMAFPGTECLAADLELLPELQTESNKQVLKIILTRGSGRRGYSYSSDAGTNRIIMHSDWPQFSGQPEETGVNVRTCQLRLAHQPSLAGIKHLNRLEQVIARSEWQDTDIAEGLMLDTEEHIIEGTMTNVFVVIDGELLTPMLDQCGVQGVQRDNIIVMAKQSQIPVKACKIKRSLLESATEIFLSNSIIGIWPVTQVDSNHFDIGPITRSLQQLLVSQV